MKPRSRRSGVLLAVVALAAGARCADATPEPGKPFALAEPALRLLWIAPGEFLLGSPAEENSRGTDEGPQTRVKITQGFWLGRIEVTQAQWHAVMRTDPSRFRGDALPVEQVSWH